MKKIKYTIAILALFIGFTACKKQLTDMNNNPLALTSLPDEYLFTTAVLQTFGDGSYISLYHLRFCSQYAQFYVTNSEDRSADGYYDFHTQDVYAQMFTLTYENPLVYINKVLSLTSAGTTKNPVRNAMAQIVAVINFAQATDCWGDIPYFQGAQGATFPYPKYDAQKDIYYDMMTRLKSAMNVLSNANPADGYVGAEPVYNNDLTKWVRFANSLRLRLAMKARFADPANSATVITECLSGPLIETNDQNFELTHQDSDNPQLYNPWFDIRKAQNFKMSDKFTSWLQSTSDPRLEIFEQPDSAGIRKGVLNGLNDQSFSLLNWSDYSDPTPLLYSKSLPQYMMCASEVWFLRAEAGLYNLGTGDPNQFYQQGINLNMQLWHTNTAAVTNFLVNQPEATLNGSAENKFRQICTQAWIAFLPNFTEAWTNIRRTGYPVIPHRTDATVYSLGVTNGILPTRFKYASTEYLSNLVNVNKAISQQGPDLINTPVWWDVKSN